MLTADLDFDLPPERIATAPAQPRDHAKLMVIRRDTGTIEHRRVADLPAMGLLSAGDLMVVNRSAVLPAWFEATRAATGGRVTGLYLGPAPDGTSWDVLIEARGSLREGEMLTLDDAASLTLTAAHGGGRWWARLTGGGDALAVLQRVGRPPLPPYIRKARKQLGLPEFNEEDATRYNTVYAEVPGSVAAPTAGLHFTPALLASLEAQGVRRAAVTLHVGVGTFAPVRSETLAGHVLHEEPWSVSAETLAALRETRAAGRRILAVGTTSVRTLESLPDVLPNEGLSGSTGLYIRPDAGFTFRYTDALLTNFHLPRSTLLALVASLPGVGLPRLLDWYAEAIRHEYRFYSYGDAMLIW